MHLRRKCTLWLLDGMSVHCSATLQSCPHVRRSSNLFRTDVGERRHSPVGGDLLEDAKASGLLVHGVEMGGGGGSWFREM